MDKFVTTVKPQASTASPASLASQTDEETSPVYKLFTDGASRGNGKNGVGAAGCVIFDAEDKVIKELSKFLGMGVTNNVAEYKALILGLKLALEQKIKRIRVYVDSKLVCEQLKGTWKINKSHLRPLKAEAKQLSEKFETFYIGHVRREFNTHADRLANEAYN
jgi:ribonuclease HI